MAKTTFKIPAAGTTDDERTAALEAIRSMDLSGVEDLAAAEQAVVDEGERIAALDDPSDADLDRLEALGDLADSIRAEHATREGAVEQRRTRAAEARKKLAGPAAEGEGDEGDGSDGDDDEGQGDDDEGDETPDGGAGSEGDGDEGDNEGEGDRAPEAVAAAAARRSGNPAVRGRAPSLIRGARQHRSNNPRPQREHQEQGGLTITASAGIRGIEAGSELEGMDALVDAFMTRASSHPRALIPDQYQRHAVASLSRGQDAFNGLHDMNPEYADNPMALLDAAADESRLVSRDGKKSGSLAAAGGWCAPSETLYDFVSYETTDGIFDMPEVGVRRGGLNITQGPDFSAIYAGSGFSQTEAQAIAGDTKNCYEVDCPDFDETRLDAVGLCIKNGFLTNTAYPELVRRVLAGALVAHEHKKGIRALNAVRSELGTAVAVADSGSTARSVLTGLELAAEGQRAAFRMGRNQTMEVVLPHWVRVSLRDDLQARLRMVDPVTDAQLDAHFAARKLNVQFVYGFGDTNVVSVPGGGTLLIAIPATFQALMYPAGAFIKGVADVINLDTVYDSTDLEVNVYTAAFIEEAMLVARRAPGGGVLTFQTNNSGAVGPATLPAYAEQA